MQCYLSSRLGRARRTLKVNNCHHHLDECEDPTTHDQALNHPAFDLTAFANYEGTFKAIITLSTKGQSTKLSSSRRIIVVGGIIGGWLQREKAGIIGGG